MGRVFNSCTEPDVDLLVQQRCGWTGTKGRLRREDCKFVKHDKLFSKWKILMGPADSTGQINSAGVKDKLSHVHNLPATQFGPGVYELGVTAPSWSKAANNTRALKREDVIPVYIGQATNVRQRLQKYGQAGAQFEQASSRSPKLHQAWENDSVGSPRMAQNGFKGSELAAKSSGSGPRLFSEVFALGSSIAFRWAHTDSKVVAEHVESELLAVFDYAWNKGSSGTRRSRDILAKLFMAWPTKNTTTTARLRNLIFSGERSRPRWLFCGRSNAVGIKVALRKPHDTTNSTYSIMSNLCFYMTAQPQCSRTHGRGGPIMACNAPPRKHRYKIKPAASTSRKINMTLRAETTRGFLRREFFYPTKTKTYNCKEVEDKTAERRRHNSLSFNTWVKGETDQRVHDNSNMSELSSINTSFQKLSVSDSKRRLQHLGSKYASVCDSDSMRG